MSQYGVLAARLSNELKTLDGVVQAAQSQRSKAEKTGDILSGGGVEPAKLLHGPSNASLKMLKPFVSFFWNWITLSDPQLFRPEEP